MASKYMLELRNSSETHNATGFYKYMSREGKHKNADGENLVACWSGNMPEWAENPKDFWEKADIYERKGGAVYRGITLRLSHELTDEQNIAMVQDFLKDNIKDKHAYSIAIHSKPSSVEGIMNIHAHIMIDYREQDGRKLEAPHYFKQPNSRNPAKSGLYKKDPYNEKNGVSNKNLIKAREQWKDIQNLHLERAGLDVRVDHRSLADQGLETVPQKRLSQNEYKAWQRTGIKTEGIKTNDRIRRHNKAIKGIDSEMTYCENSKARLKNNQIMNEKIVKQEAENQKIIQEILEKNRMYKTAPVPKVEPKIEIAVEIEPKQQIDTTSFEYKKELQKAKVDKLRKEFADAEHMNKIDPRKSREKPIAELKKALHEATWEYVTVYCKEEKKEVSEIDREKERELKRTRDTFSY